MTPPASASASSSTTKPAAGKRPSPASAAAHLPGALSPSITICSSCKSSPSATFDLLLLVLVLFSGAFLVASSISHLVRSLALLIPTSPLALLLSSPSSYRDAPLPYLAGLFLFLAVSLAAIELSCCCLGGGKPCPWPGRRRRCSNPRCRGLTKALEFDVQLQTEEAIRSPDPAQAATWKEIEDLPWKGGQQGNNPDYECLRAELRKMAPPNGRAVLLFRARCGCPLAKLEAWGPKRGRRVKKGHAELGT